VNVTCDGLNPFLSRYSCYVDLLEPIFHTSIQAVRYLLISISRRYILMGLTQINVVEFDMFVGGREITLVNLYMVHKMALMVAEVLIYH
jgi:hypothetical protein